MENFDLAKFWEKDEISHRENCFYAGAPQVALGIRMSKECVFAELKEEGNPWGYTEPMRMSELCKRYNDKAEKIVGKRLLDESIPDINKKFPDIKRIGEVFGGKYVHNGISEWLMPSCKTPDELESVLNTVDKTDIKSFILPDNWQSEKKRIYETYGIKPPVFRGIRGPVTLAMSLFGSENLIFLILDNPSLAKRFSDTITRVIKGYIDIMDGEAGLTDAEKPSGFSWADDDCCLLNPDMYEFFAYPILKSVFDYVSPNADDKRYQHSDSAMGHLLPILAKLNLTGCNFGPTVMIDEIRKYMPETRIDGQLAPFTFMRNDEKAIKAEVKRDCEMAKRTGRGVNLSTAGSINDGSLLTSMRYVMETIEEYGQY